MTARVVPGLIAANERVALPLDELVIVVPAGVGHIRDLDPRRVRNAGERVRLLLERGAFEAEVAEVREVARGTRVLARGREGFGWHEVLIG